MAYKWVCSGCIHFGLATLYQNVIAESAPKHRCINIYVLFKLSPILQEMFPMVKYFSKPTIQVGNVAAGFCMFSAFKSRASLFQFRATILKGAGIALLAILFMGCSSRTVVESDMGLKGAPDWVNEGIQALKDGDKRFFRGIGSAPIMNDMSLQNNTADNRARAELAQIFTSYIKVLANDYSASVSDSDEVVNQQTVSRSINNITQLNLVGAEIIARWRDKTTGVIYSLAEIDMKKFKTVTAAANDMDAHLKIFVENEAQNTFDKMLEKK
ncbi:MAG: hypothetical protein ACJA0N_001946 [Pseudohongiellaceae bacterium]|jgi:hypothetical protein